MRVLAFGLPHFRRLDGQARRLDPSIRLVGVFRRPMDRLGRLRALLPLSREETRRLGAEAYAEASPRIAWGNAEAVWRRVERADAVVVWNGCRGHGLVAARAAEALGKRIVYVENGLLPDTVQVDRRGINFASSLALLRPEDIPESPELGSLAFRQRPLGSDTGLPADAERPPGLPPEFVLYAAQVHDDSQIVRFSPDWTSVDEAIRYAAAECAAVGLSLVVKEHPQDHGRIDRSALRAELPNVRFLTNVDNAALIAACRAFVTINSSLALQAVAAGKPVLTLGDAAYNLPGVATRIRPPARLRDALLDPRVDTDLRRRYLAHLKHTALVPFNTRLATDEQLRALARRIVELLGN